MPPAEMHTRWSTAPDEIKMMIIESGVPEQLKIELNACYAAPDNNSGYNVVAFFASLGFHGLGPGKYPEWRQLQRLRCVCRATRASIDRIIKNGLGTLVIKALTFMPVKLPTTLRVEAGFLEDLLPGA